MNSCSGVPGQHLHHRGSVSDRESHLEFLSHLQVVVVGKVPRQAVHLDPRVLVLGDELERDRHQTVLLQRRDLARVRTGHFDLRVRLPDDVEVRDRPDVVGRVAVDRDPASEDAAS